MKSKNVQVAALLLVAALLPAQAMAGAGGTEFTQVYDQLTGWANGTLGKVLGIAALLVLQTVMLRRKYPGGLLPNPARAPG